MRSFFKDKVMMKNILQLVTGTMISQVINIIASPLLSRLYTPAEFGLSTMFQSITSLVLIIFTLKLDSAIIVPKSELLAKRLLKSSLFYTAVSSIVFFFFLLLMNILGIDILGFENSLFIILILSLASCFSGINSSYTNWANRQKDYKVMMWIPILNTLTATTANIILGLLEYKEYGLILGIVFGLFISTLFLMFIYRVPTVDPKLILTTKKFSNFPLYQMPSMLLNTLSVQIAVFAFYYFYNDVITGWYSMAQRILLLPLTILGSAIAQIYFKEAILLFQAKAPLDKLTEKILYSSYLIILVPIFIIMSFGDLLFGFIFGKEWTSAGKISIYLAPWFMMVFIASPLSTIFIILEKQKENLFFNIIMLLTRIGAIWIGSLIFDNYINTVALFGITGFVLWYILSFYLISLVGIKFSKYFRYTSIYFLILIISVIIVRLLLK